MTPAYPAITKANLVTLIAVLQLSKTCSIMLRLAAEPGRALESHAVLLLCGAGSDAGCMAELTAVGAPSGEKNGIYKHGLFTHEAVEERRLLRALLGKVSALLNDVSEL